MTMLTDHEIRNMPGLITGELDDSQYQPCSVDVTLELSDWKLLTPDGGPVEPSHSPPRFIHGGSEKSFLLPPGSLLLASTREFVKLPANIAGRIEGKSSLGRMGITAHVTAGFIDPGFEGYITLEITSFVRPVRLRDGMRIAQICFERLNSPVERPYGHPDLGSHYQNQQGTQVPSRVKS